MFVPAALGTKRMVWAIPCLVVALASLRLCHIHLLWADEDYHMAAAINILHGRVPYRDFWYDKPPLCALFYLLVGGYAGWPLRILDAGYVLIASHLAYLLARDWWTEADALGKREGLTAALLLAFYLAFYLPSAVIPFAADALMIIPHLAAIYSARRRRAIWAGVWAGIALLVNTKGVFVLLACAIFSVGQLLPLLVGFGLPILAGLAGALLSGTWTGYFEQVWGWGWIYMQAAPVVNPLKAGLARTLNWLGFQGVLIAGASYALIRVRRSDRIQLLLWIALSFGAVCLGGRFVPRYFLQLLPPLTVAASRGIVLGLRAYPRAGAAILAALLLVPSIRFGPRYASLALDNLSHREPNWSDVAMDLDSQRVAAKIRSMAQPGDTLFVWGYRPDVYVYTRMTSDSLFWDSQPLTGVPADRHLSATGPIYSGPAIGNRQRLSHSHPTWIVDGLSLLNPKLTPVMYPELQPWLAQYKPIGRTALSLIYHRIG